jgi:hypothetical protein
LVTETRVPYTEAEAQEAWHWVNRYGPRNAWTAGLGTAARMIGRLLEERERLAAIIAARENVTCWQQPHD